MITQEDHEEAAKKIVELVQKKLPGYYRTPVSQIQCSEDGCRRESTLWKQIRTDQKEEHMAIIINIYYTGINGSARKFAEEMVSAGVVKEIREETGNLKYEYFFPMDDAETVLLIDSWENQEAIDLHHESPMMAEILKLREKYDLHMRVERYVTDEGGVPQTDKVFIRK